MCARICVPACLHACLAVCAYCMSAEERQFDKIIHSKQPNGNIPTGCFSSSTQIILHSNFPPSAELPLPERRVQSDTYTPDIWFFHGVVTGYRQNISLIQIILECKISQLTKEETQPRVQLKLLTFLEWAAAWFLTDADMIIGTNFFFLVLKTNHSTLKVVGKLY